MSTRDLFEMASLDVLGLLDEDERRDFEQALRAATPEVQAQIRREQLRMSDLDAWLPRVDAPAGLKARVVFAVRDAIHAVRAGGVAQRVGPLSIALQRNVSPLWRAACIGLVAATLGLGFTAYQVQSNLNVAVRTFKGEGAIGQMQAAFGSRVIDGILSPEADLVAFKAGDGAPAGRAVRASIVHDPGKEAFFICRDLPQAEGGYRLVLVADDGTIGQVLATFEHTEHVVQIASAIPAGSRLAVIPAAATSLSSAVLISV